MRLEPGPRRRSWCAASGRVSNGTLIVRVRQLAPRTTYEIVVHGVRIGTLTTNGAGRGHARFRTHPRDHDGLLGVDPRGQRIAVHALTGRDALRGVMPERAGVGLVRCCMPDDRDAASGCTSVTATTCHDKGGTNVGAGSCMPNPCPPPSAQKKTRCCIPGDDEDDDGEVECKQRMSDWCAKKGGVDIGPGECNARSCPPPPPPEPD